MIYIPGPVSSIARHPHKLSFHARPGIQGFCGLAFHAFMFHDLFLTQYAHHIVIPCKTWYPGLLWFGVSCHHVSWFIPPTIHYTHIQGLSTHRMCLSFSDYYQLLSHANPLLDLPRDFGLGFNLRFGNTECGVFLAHGTIFASSWLDQWTGGLSLYDPWASGIEVQHWQKPWDVQLWPWATVHSCLLVWDMAEGWMFTCTPVHGWRLECQWAKD